MKTTHHIALNVYCFALVALCAVVGCDSKQPPASTSNFAETNQALRDAAITYLRSLLPPAGAASTTRTPDELAHSGGWKVHITLYDNGKLLGEGNCTRDLLVDALHEAIEELKKRHRYGPPSNIPSTPTDLTNPQISMKSRFFVTLQKKEQPAFSFVEYNGKGLEIVDDPIWQKEILNRVRRRVGTSQPINATGDLVAVRQLDQAMLPQQIDACKGYLLRIMNPDKHAFFKRFDATTGVHDKRLRTIYTASSLYTLLKMNDLAPDSVIEEQIPQIAAFLLSMQSKGPDYPGAFHYSINSATGEKEKSFVVGTASKTIYTLLELYRKTKNPAYLESAKAAGDWLLTMQKSDGTIVNSVHFKDGQWIKNEKFSTLYLGQVISALSRLYAATEDKRYLHGAEISVDVLLQRAKKMDYFMQDDFRLSDDPIPTTWAVQSLLDFYKVTKNQSVKDTLLQCANVVLKRQHVDPNDVANFGRFEGTYATSGNGWINEVFMELYQYGQSEFWTDIEPFKTAAIRVTRWLMQNTYSPQNTFFLAHGPEAIGGLIRSYREESVRTDAVCHGSNGCVLLLSCTEPGVLLTLSETKPLVDDTHSE